jgi:hypothetical protein
MTHLQPKAGQICQILPRTDILIAVTFPLMECPYDQRLHFADIVDIFIQYLLIAQLLHHLVAL